MDSNGRVGESPIFTVIDFDIVIILKVLLLVSLSFLAVAFEFFTRRFFGFGFWLCPFHFVKGSEP